MKFSDVALMRRQQKLTKEKVMNFEWEMRKEFLNFSFLLVEGR
jgi:hypothetical protein